MTALADAFLAVPLAHRALHDVADARPENSRAAVRAAVAAGYGIEIDLQASRDGAAMVFHDYDLGRLTPETGPLRQHDAAQLARIPLTGGKEGIPDLPEILGLVAGRVPLLIELKDQHGGMGQTDGTLEAATAVALAGYAGPVAVMSFNPHMMMAMADLRLRGRRLAASARRDARAAAHHRRLRRGGGVVRQPRGGRPRQPASGPPARGGRGDPVLDRAQPRGRGARARGGRYHHLRGVSARYPGLMPPPDAPDRARTARNRQQAR
jgi:hypothetical protein